MKKPFFSKFILSLVSVFAATICPGNLHAQPYSEGILSLRSVVRVTDAAAPWRIPLTKEIEGSAVIIGKDFIFTDLEAVRYSVFIELRNPLTGAVSEAVVKHAGFDSGLAMLEARQPEVLSGLAGFDLSDSVPSAGEEAVLAGSLGWMQSAGRYNERIQKTAVALPVFSHTDYLDLLYFREPASVPVRTGSAVLKDNKLIGIYCTYPEKGIHYAIDASEIRRFLSDVSDGVYNGKPLLQAVTVPLLTPDARRYYLLEDSENGLLVSRLSPGYAPLREGDVILGIEDAAVNEAGLVGRDGNFMTLRDYLRKKSSVNLKLKIKRAGAVYEITVSFPSESMMRSSTDFTMPYFLSGGLVFTRQDFRLMNNPVFAADLTASYRYYYRTKDQLYLETDEDVIFLGALDDEAVKDYADYRGFTVYRINGQRVRSLRDFVSKWKNAAERRIVIEFVNQVGKIVIDRDKAGETDRRINERFRPQENGRVY